MRSEVNPNAYSIERLTLETLGIFKSRQLRPHRVPTWKPVEDPREISIREKSQETEDSEPISSVEVETPYEPETNSSQPGPSGTRTRRRSRLSVMARKLSANSSESEEQYIQPRRTYKLDDQYESPPNSDETWELVIVPKRKRVYPTVEIGGRTSSESS